MSEIIKMRSRNQLTLPKKYIDVLDLKEGDTLEVYLENDRLVIVPVVTMEKKQYWFLTQEWQEGEKEASEDIANKRLKEFDNINDAFEWLDSEDKEGE
ncbi:AbrB/MazE/SpoVT family DNA-binding domain-containing protein [Bacillus cereus]|uniref:AbrB/MazE/SpoVT family DNA-binding domain-containing protein n=1 Tax=Bacillus cereus group TaxID=86661 RepID=UPI0009B52F68|nr:AbrB/MazE/SpoVT family DNA-binding domain-containing protein [Bacillus cereus]PGS88031.1 AbrB/MazE/SpoVT family DNA-binding domain-containing protein [Bacillus cereus]